MTRSALAPWRVCFAAFGVLVFAGGPTHPKGRMAEMLAHPDWVMPHLLTVWPSRVQTPQLERV